MTIIVLFPRRKTPGLEKKTTLAEQKWHENLSNGFLEIR
jgi:capsule polysaccharide modification protein KpsS